MAITIDPKLEAQTRERAEAEGISIDAYVERLIRADQAAEDEIESLALEELNSGEPIPITPNYWEEKHRQLDERLKKTGTR
jgi:antitoxin ParD1/3/4